MPTANFYVGPSDNWVAVASGPGFIRISASPVTFPFYVYGSNSPPVVASPNGVLNTDEPFTVNVDTTDTYYVRTINSQADSFNKDGKVRIDVFTIGGSPTPTPTPPGNWILTTGLWDDTGVWDDSANWIDG